MGHRAEMGKVGGYILMAYFCLSETASGLNTVTWKPGMSDGAIGKIQTPACPDCLSQTMTDRLAIGFLS